MAKLNDLETHMVDPLDYLIGFFSVVGRKSHQAEGSQSIISQGAAGSANARSSGVTSVLCVRSGDLAKLPTSSTSKRTVSKKVTNSHQMTSAGSGSESATMIKVAQKLGPASSLVATSDASASNRQQPEDLNH